MAAELAERQKRLPYPLPSHVVGKLPSLNLLRKVQCHGGWDWGPCLPVSGIYGGIYLGATSLARIEYVTCIQSHESGRCTVDVTVHLHGVASGRARLSVSLGEVETTTDLDVTPGPQTHSAQVVVDHPALFVTLDAEGIGGEWSDNCLFLLPERPIEVAFTPRRPTSPQRLAESLRVRHLRSAC